MGNICVQDPTMYAAQHRARLICDTKYKQEYQYKVHRSYESHKYALVIQNYMSYYGKPINENIKQFIKNNYSQNYEGKIIYLNGNRVYSNKDSLLKRFQDLNKEKLTSHNLLFQGINQSNNSIQYTWTCKKNGQDLFHYRCVANFDQRDKIRKVQFNQVYKAKPINYRYSPPKIQQSYLPEQSNNYYKPDPGIDYGARMQQQRQQFRKKMNREAQQWNEYNRQKAKRGY